MIPEPRTDSRTVQVDFDSKIAQILRWPDSRTEQNRRRSNGTGCKHNSLSKYTLAVRELCSYGLIAVEQQPADETFWPDGEIGALARAFEIPEGRRNPDRVSAIQWPCADAADADCVVIADVSKAG
jgi:hypothetical protein